MTPNQIIIDWLIAGIISVPSAIELMGEIKHNLLIINQN